MSNLYLASIISYILLYNLVKIRLKLNSIEQQNHDTLLVCLVAVCPIVNSFASLLLVYGLIISKDKFIELNK